MMDIFLKIIKAAFFTPEAALTVGKCRLKLPFQEKKSYDVKCTIAKGYSESCFFI